MFFVISGFVMVISNHKAFGNISSLGEYILRRLTRIYPLFWLVCLPQLLWMILHDKVPFKACYRGLLLIPPHTWTISHVAWTLSYEVYFYLIFGAMMLFSFRFLPLFLLTWVGIILLADKNPYIANLPDYLNIVFAVINVTFIFGASIALCTVKRLYFSVSPLLLGAAFLLIIAGFSKHHGLVNFDNDFHPRLFLLGLPSALVLFAAVSAEKQSGLLLPKRLKQLGDASYSIYLTHLLFIHQTKSLTAQFSNTGVRVLWILIMIAACLALGLLVHHILEKPILKCIRHLVSNRTRRGTLRAEVEQVPSSLVTAT